ncbi:hypothetical protein JCM11641_003234 [Rhodosporidiobolus odoratus]
MDAISSPPPSPPVPRASLSDAFASSTSSTHRSPPSSARPSSAHSAKGSTAGSSRPWVFDSDASSVCSGKSNHSAPFHHHPPQQQPSQNNTPPWSPPSYSHSGGHGNGRRPTSTRGSRDGSAGKLGDRRYIINDEGLEEEVDEGGEVFKAPGDMEFLDHRPEPAGASIRIDRSDTCQVVVHVTLPGFTLDNITVAMRRGHRIHIVADSYGKEGGHFEKLVNLGSDVSSAAPRAEFNGTTLRIYIQRRPSRPSSAASTSNSTPAPSGIGANGFTNAGIPPSASIASPTSSAFSSPELSSAALMDHTRRPSIAASLASTWSDCSNASSGSGAGGLYPQLSPSLESAATYPPFSSPLDSPGPLDDLPPPHTARAPALYHDSKRSKSLTGPEGARAAAKAAKAEMARRAEEEGKKLPREARGPRRCPFREQRAESASSQAGSVASSSSASIENGSGSSSASSLERGGDGSSSASAYTTSASESEASPPLVKEGLTSAGFGKIMVGLPRYPRPVEVGRNGTIKAPSTSPRTASSSPTSSRGASPVQSTMASALSYTASSPSFPSGLAASIPSSEEHSPPAPDSTRPKLLASNLTLRALPSPYFPDAQATQTTFAELAEAHSHSHGRGHDHQPAAKRLPSDSSVGSAGSAGTTTAGGNGSGSDGGGATPKWEVGEMKFTPVT